MPKQYFDTGSKNVNLKNVTSVSIEENINRKKIIFNFDYTITHPYKPDVFVSDYVSVYYDDDQEFKKVFKELSSQLESLYWFEGQNSLDLEGPDKIWHWVNIDKVSFITYDEHKNRIILNLSCTVTKRHSSGELTSDFVYFSYPTKSEFMKNRERLENLINSKFI